MDNERRDLHRRRHLLLERSAALETVRYTWCLAKPEATPAALRALCGRVQLVSEYAAENQCRTVEHRPPFN
jgi:hypothetical protein